MAQVKLDTISADMDKEKLQASLISNNEATRQGFARITSQVLAGLRLRANKTMSTTPLKIPELSAAVNCSGGLVTILAVLHCAPQTGYQIRAEVFLDGQIVDSSAFGVASVEAYGEIVLTYSANLNGQHKVEVRGYSNAGAGAILPYSSLTVTEHLS